MKVTALLRVARNVADLQRAEAFYGALGFCAVTPARGDALLARLLRIERMRILRMRLVAQEIELSECSPPGAAYPADMAASDPRFQHIAIVTDDIVRASERVMSLGVAPISRDGPVHLPVASGGVTAFKFRDPDGHPLELLQFPAGRPRGFDHSAISVREVERSVEFYAKIGVCEVSRQVNTGPEQDALDGLADAHVDVLALRPPQPTPHVELLCYRQSHDNFTLCCALNDIAADRLVFHTTDGGLRLRRDPDGHVVLLDGR